MAKLTKAQQSFLNYIDKYRGSIYFTREIKTEKEKCFVGRKSINEKVFFFFYDMGYLELDYKWDGRKYEYFYMKCCLYKLNDYINDFKPPYCPPE